MRISDWSSDVCSSDLHVEYAIQLLGPEHVAIATDMFDGKTKVNWATPWYYPEIARNANYVTRRIEGFRTKSELINVVERLLNRGYSADDVKKVLGGRSEEHTSELQSLMRISYAVFCLKKKNRQSRKNT